MGFGTVINGLFDRAPASLRNGAAQVVAHSSANDPAALDRIPGALGTLDGSAQALRTSPVGGLVGIASDAESQLGDIGIELRLTIPTAGAALADDAEKIAVRVR